MATVACPSCGLPRAEDLFGVVACPLCGHAGVLAPAGILDAPPSELAHAASAESLPSVPPPTPSGGRFLVGFVAGIAAGVVGVIGWPQVRDLLPVFGSIAVAQADPPVAEGPGGPFPPPVSTPIVSTSHHLTAGSPALPIPPPNPSLQPPPQTLTPHDPVGLGPQAQPVPPNPFRPAAPAAIRIDNPDGESHPIIRPGSTLILRGRVKKLCVSGLEAGAVLDCSELDAREVEVLGKIDGGSRLVVRAPGGKVTFLARVGGKSIIDIRAPGGTVAFEAATHPTGDGSTISGGAMVEVMARSVGFRAAIAGAGTRVSVTLTTDGNLSFTEIDGPSRLEYSKADPGDPELIVKTGKIGPESIVKSQ